MKKIDIIQRRHTVGKDTSYTPHKLSGERVSTASTKNGRPDVGVAVARSSGQAIVPKTQEELRPPEGQVGLETSSLPGNTTASGIVPRGYYNSIVDGLFDPELYDNSNQKQGREGKSPISAVYRDMYYHDPICGNGVDIMSTMPFSEFVLSGAKNDQSLDPYYESLSNMRIRSFLPSVSVDYLVHGLYCGTTLFDEEKKVYTGNVPQNVDRIHCQPIPIYGRDPTVSLMTGDALKELEASDDPRVKEYLETLPKAARGGDNYKPDPKDVIFIPRRAMLRDYRGMSIYRRLLMAWLLEKALYRGTVDQAFRRQKAVTHMQVGDDEWTPTANEMTALADMLLNADLDPVGAVFVTRLGVQMNETRGVGDLWKVSDMADYFTTVKYKALGISESFIDGTASYNAMETLMTTFVEQMKEYRELMTFELFYDKVFPRISEANSMQAMSHGVQDNSSIVNELSKEEIRRAMENGMRMDTSAGTRNRGTYYHSAKRNTPLFLPEIHFLKKLRPEADETYMAMLTELSEHGIPVPIRTWATAGGLDIDTVIGNFEDDRAMAEALKEHKDALKEISGTKGEGEDGEDGDFNLASVTGYDRIERKGLGLRSLHTDDPKYLLNNYGASFFDTMPKTAKGRKRWEETRNKVISQAAAKVSGIENKKDVEKEKRMVKDMKKRHYPVKARSK